MGLDTYGKHVFLAISVGYKNVVRPGVPKGTCMEALVGCASIYRMKYSVLLCMLYQLVYTASRNL